MFADRRALAGQALTECLVASIALVPLVLLTLWLGKVDALRQAGIAASRLLAFECTVRPDACKRVAEHPELADELRRRVFSRPETPVLTADRVSGQTGEHHPLWVDRANRPLLERFSDIAIQIDQPRFDAGGAVAEGRAGALTGAGVHLTDALAGPGRFGLDVANGLFDARVQIGVTPGARADGFRSQLDSIPLRMRAHTAILTDAWNASGPEGAAPDSVQSRVAAGGSLPQLHEATLDARHALTRGLISAMGAIGLEPAADRFRYRVIDVDRIPADRLGRAEGMP